MHAIDPNLEAPLVLPWPPSVNTLWRHDGSKHLISKQYRLYKKLIAQYALLWRRKPLEGRLSIDIKAYPPDKRRRDLDNLLKGCIDALQGAKIFIDDSQIDKLSIERMCVKKGGELHVYIKEMVENGKD